MSAAVGRVSRARLSTLVAVALLASAGSRQTEVAASIPASEVPRPRVVVELMSGVPRLSVCLENATREAIPLMSGSLPWATRYGLILIATSASGAGTEVLTQPLVYGDPTRQLVLLNPGERKCGEVDLVKRLPGLVDMQARSDVVVFWAYPDGLESSGGMVVLARRH